MGRAACGCALALALAACSVGKPYQRPALDVPAGFRDAQAGAIAGESLGELDWWQVYRDPALRRLLETALAKNRDLRVAVARVAEAGALVGQARTAQWPQLGVSLGAERGRVVQSRGYVTGGLFTGSADATYEADVWRRLGSLTDAARANLLATQAGRGAVQAGLMSAVATAYFSLLSLDRQSLVTTRTIENRQHFLDLTRRMANRGAASAVDVSRAAANLAQAQAVLPDLQRQIVQTENQLQILLGGNPAPVAREETTALPQLPDVPPGLPSSLLERRADLLQAEALLSGATANVNAAKAALFPTITLTGSIGSESFALADLFSGPSRIWTLGINLVQPILNAQRNGYAVSAAESREQQAILQYRSAVAQAFREVADALAARRSYADTILAMQEQVRALRDVLTRAFERYEIGRASYFEVIDADAALLSAELQLVQAQRGGLVASVQLYQALGGGWDRREIGSTTALPD